MQSIHIPDDRYQKLSEVAHAAGYADVSAFLNALADEPTEDPRGALSAEDLRESLSECDQSMAELNSGGGRDAEQALLDLGSKRGFDMGE